jgi:hypothetical protein
MRVHERVTTEQCQVRSERRGVRSEKQPVGAQGAAPLPFQPVTAPGFGIFSDSLAMSRQGGLKTRPYPDPTIRHSRFAVLRHSLFAIRCFFPLATRYSPSFPIRHSRLLSLGTRHSP